MTRPSNGMAAGVIVEDRAWLDRLDGELRGELAPVFAQASSRLTAFSYFGALLAEPGDRKSCWQLAERAGHATPRRMQALLAEYVWDWMAALAALQRFIVAQLGDPEAIVVLDETAELKKGTATVGVARQHAGITGQVNLAIEPVVHDASSPVSDYWGRAFLGARLEWIGAPKAGVDSPSPSDFGPLAASRLETVTWEGWQLRVPPLDLQRAVSQRRGLTSRVALIDAIRSQ